MENEKYVVKVFEIYPAWGMGQLVGAVVCNDEFEADKIANEISDNMNTRTKVEKVTGDFEDDLQKEWAQDIDKLTRNYHYVVRGLNIISSDDYYQKGGFEEVSPDFDDMVYTEDGEFLGWFDAMKDAVVDAHGDVVGRYDDNGNFVREKKENV